MNRLNYGKPRQYVVGDLVSKGLSSEWKPKHMPKWRGPMHVTKKLSKSTYEVNEVSSGRTYQRSVANINRYKAGAGVLQQDQKEQVKSFFRCVRTFLGESNYKTTINRVKEGIGRRRRQPHMKRSAVVFVVGRMRMRMKMKMKMSFWRRVSGYASARKA